MIIHTLRSSRQSVAKNKQYEYKSLWQYGSYFALRSLVLSSSQQSQLAGGWTHKHITSQVRPGVQLLSLPSGLPNIYLASYPVASFLSISQYHYLSMISNHFVSV